MVRKAGIGIRFVLLLHLAAGSLILVFGQSGSKLRFEEITSKAGINVRHHIRSYKGKNADVLQMFTSGGAAVAVGDYDNDGYEDVFITDSETGNPNHLFHNTHDLTFSDVAEQAGVAGGNDASNIV